MFMPEMAAFVQRVREISGLALLFDDSLILVMGANPDPNDIFAIFHSESSVMDPNSDGPHVPNLFEMQ
jgi:hypothetical protein